MKKIKMAPRVLDYGVFEADFLGHQEMMSYLIMPRYFKSLLSKESLGNASILDVGLSLL